MTSTTKIHFLPILEAGKCKVKVLVWLASGDGTSWLTDGRFVLTRPFCWARMDRKWGNCLVSKDTNPTGQGAALMTSYALTTSLKSPSSHTATLQARALVYECGESLSVHNSPLLFALNKYLPLLFYREKRRHISDTSSNSCHWIENSSCTCNCHFFLPLLQQKMEGFYLPDQRLTWLLILFTVFSKSHNLSSSFFKYLLIIFSLKYS